MAQKNYATDRALGARVRFARIEQRISQGSLGEQLGISFQQVQKYELGKDRISAAQLLNIARVLGKDVAFFYEDMGDPGDTGGAPLADIVDRRGRPRGSMQYDIKIIRVLSRIPDDRVKARIYGLLEALAYPVPVAEVAAPLQAAE